MVEFFILIYKLRVIRQEAFWLVLYVLEASKSILSYLLQKVNNCWQQIPVNFLQTNDY